MVTDAQVRRLKRLSKTETKDLAAAKAGMDVKTARRYLADGRLPSEVKPERNWRTRPDPFEAVWGEIREQIQTNPGLEAKTIFAALQRKYPSQFADGQLRTLQRQIKHWRATEGPGQEVYFAQQHQRLQKTASSRWPDLLVSNDDFDFDQPSSGVKNRWLILKCNEERENPEKRHRLSQAECHEGTILRFAIVNNGPSRFVSSPTWQSASGRRRSAKLGS